MLMPPSHCRTSGAPICRSLLMWLFLVACPNGLLSGQDERYLLTFKAYPHHEQKERNLYDLVARIIHVYRETERSEAVETNKGIRYSVRSVVSVRVLNSSTSEKSPKSTHNGVYVLVYDAIYTICARSYNIADGKINYDDYESGKHYEFPIYHRRSMAIYEVQIVSQNILLDWLKQQWSATRLFFLSSTYQK